MLFPFFSNMIRYIRKNIQSNESEVRSFYGYYNAGNRKCNGHRVL